MTKQPNNQTTKQPDDQTTKQLNNQKTKRPSFRNCFLKIKKKKVTNNKTIY
jgi:hypothetical protein